MENEITQQKSNEQAPPGADTLPKPPAPPQPPSPTVQKDPFYKSTVFIVILLIVVPPLGIIFTWLFKKPRKMLARVLLTILGALIIVFNLYSSYIAFSAASQPSYKEQAQDYPPSSSYDDNAERKTPTAHEDSASSTEENEAALKKAQFYSNDMHMSKASILHQLTSQYGEGFSDEAAQYAVDKVGADWKANALATAKLYKKSQGMSVEKIHERLLSSSDGFTQEEADYAVANLDK